jgi:hypothetical protein
MMFLDRPQARKFGDNFSIHIFEFTDEVIDIATGFLAS